MQSAELDALKEDDRMRGNQTMKMEKEIEGLRQSMKVKDTKHGECLEDMNRSKVSIQQRHTKEAQMHQIEGKDLKKTKKPKRMQSEFE